MSLSVRHRASACLSNGSVTVKTTAKTVRTNRRHAVGYTIDVINVEMKIKTLKKRKNVQKIKKKRL